MQQLASPLHTDATTIPIQYYLQYAWSAQNYLFCSQQVNDLIKQRGPKHISVN